ncbi:MAG: hypothetical protein ACXW5U_00095 [Thermoanaerobaculia bacterium]
MVQTVVQQNLMDVIAKIRTDPKLAKEFVDQPQETLQKLGVDTTKLKVQKLAPGVTEPPITEATQVCGSVGVVGCVSVGA